MAEDRVSAVHQVNLQTRLVKDYMGLRGPETGMHDDAQARAAATYNAAAEAYDDPANSFWDRFGRRTVDRLGLARSARVLDVCCGSGASALPAAEGVGADGHGLGGENGR